MADWGAMGVEGAGSYLCKPFLDALPVTGVAVSVFGGSMHETTVAASDALSAQLDDLQFELGEGPRWEAMSTRKPVLIPQVRRYDHTGWPVFAKALLETEVEALFVFPLAVGAIDAGVVELYSTEPGGLSHSEYSTALGLAESAGWTLLRKILTLNPPDEVAPQEDGSPLSRREIHQATGMVIAQTRSTAAEALMMLRAHAFSHGLSLKETAGDVVGRRLDLTPPVKTKE